MAVPIPPPPSVLDTIRAAVSDSEHPELLAALAVLALVLFLLIVLSRKHLTPEQKLAAMLQRVELLKGLGDPEIAAAVEALETKTYQKGDVIFRQDEQGDDCFFVMAGECVSTSEVYTLDKNTRVHHKKRGVGTVVEVTSDPHITTVMFDAGDSHRYVPASLHKLKPVPAVEPRVVEVMRHRPNRNESFGERALSRVEPRATTVTCRTDVTVLRLTAETFLRLRRQQDHKESLLRGVNLFETFSDDQIEKLTSVLELQEFQDKEAIIKQGDSGNHFFILDAGECVATIWNGDTDQEVKRYQPGELFGEKALLDHTVRAATIMAVGEGVRAWMVRRDAFEKKLGPLKQLKAEQYITDPRHLIATFYGKGDENGPAGTLTAGLPKDPSKQTSWFAVYRPCSRDSIAKMLGRVGTGKGLNIKGKSAKKNRLSGFVPFVQISKNEDKAALEKSPRGARTRIFFQGKEAWEKARAKLESTLVELQVEHGKKLEIDDQTVKAIHNAEYESDNKYGLDVPEGLMMEVYIHRADVSPAVGWETGRDSEPAFLDMNLHSLRDGGEPPVVLYQFDKTNPLNPLGLLMAYAEARVVPVVSDFDTFLVGSRGVHYNPTPPEQIELMNWALTHTEELLASPNNKGWMGRWLDILKKEAENGFHPSLPKFGFGDPTSYGLIGRIVDAMAVCGAVRHGAECFNFYFPQELDPDFLIVWDGVGAPPWKSVKEDELRAFLLERAKEGYSFPLNPVWPVRDPGWLEVLKELHKHEEASANLQSWFPPESGVLHRIVEMHHKYPEGFKVVNNTRRASFWANLTDCDTLDMANVADLEVIRSRKARWRKIRNAMKMQLLTVPPEKVASKIDLLNSL